MIHLTSALELPLGLEARIENPPSISENYSLSHKFEKPSVILEGKDFIAWITLKDGDDGKSHYSFRAYSKVHKLEVSGKGELYERYYRVTDPNTGKNESRVIDKGSKLIIDAGLFRVRWSAGSYIYLQDGISVEVGDEVDYRLKIKE